MFSLADAIKCSPPPSGPIERWRSFDGTPMTLRPVQVRDAPALRSLIEGLSPADRRCRFHGAVKGVSPAQLANMVCVDGQHEHALVVTARLGRDEPIVADVRYVTDHGGDGAEFALVVAGRWQRCGIGRRAMTSLLRSASRNGLQQLRGSILADNAPMLGLMRACGFACAPSAEDDDVVTARIHVPTHGAARMPDRDAAWRGRSDAWTQFG